MTNSQSICNELWQGNFYSEICITQRPHRRICQLDDCESLRRALTRLALEFYWKNPTGEIERQIGRLLYAQVNKPSLIEIIKKIWEYIGHV